MSLEGKAPLKVEEVVEHSDGTWDVSKYGKLWMEYSCLSTIVSLDTGSLGLDA